MSKALSSLNFDEDSFANWMAGLNGYLSRRWFNTTISYLHQMAERVDSLDNEASDIAKRCQNILDKINE